MSHKFKAGDLVVRHPDFIDGWDDWLIHQHPVKVIRITDRSGNLVFDKPYGSWIASRFLPFQSAVEGSVEDFA